MKTIKTKVSSTSPFRMQEGSYGKIKRTYPKPNPGIGYFESLSLIK